MQKQEHTQKIRPPSLGLYQLYEKWRGSKLITISESGIIPLLGGSEILYGTGDEYGSGFTFSFFLDPDNRNGTYSVLLSTFKQSFLC